MITDMTFKNPCCDYMAYMDKTADEVHTTENGRRVHRYFSSAGSVKGVKYTNQFDYCPFCKHRYSYNLTELGDAYIEMDCYDDCKELEHDLMCFVNGLNGEGEDVKAYSLGNELRVSNISLDSYGMLVKHMGWEAQDLEIKHKRDPNHEGTPEVNGIACWNPLNGRNIDTDTP